MYINFYLKYKFHEQFMNLSAQTIGGTELIDLNMEVTLIMNTCMWLNRELRR